MKPQKQVFVVPKNGLKVLCPDTANPIAAQGEYRQASSYWTRRAVCGDVQLFDEPPKQSKGKK